jgi:hypothetical protein
MLRVGTLLVVALLVGVCQIGAGQGDGKDKKKPDKKKAIVCTVELKDGSTVQGTYVTPDMITLAGVDLGIVTLKVESVRFLDCERATHRLSTYNLDSFLGTVQTEEFTFRLQATDATVAIPRDRIKRIVFPDPPRFLPTLTTK